MHITRQLCWDGHANRSCRTSPWQTSEKPTQTHSAGKWACVLTTKPTACYLREWHATWHSHRSAVSVRVQATPDVRVATSFVLAASTLVTAGFWWYYITQLPEQQQVPPPTKKSPAVSPKQQDGAQTASSNSQQTAVRLEETTPGSRPPGASNTGDSPTPGPGQADPKMVYKKPPSDTPYLLLTLILAIASAYTVWTRGWK